MRHSVKYNNHDGDKSESCTENSISSVGVLPLGLIVGSSSDTDTDP
jgi:hypothetical protein